VRVRRMSRVGQIPSAQNANGWPHRRTDTGGFKSLPPNAALQEVVADSAILKIWAGEGVSAFRKDERSADAGRTIMKNEVAR
jgi:hypothetical protein